MKKRIVITGLGFITSVGNAKEQVLESLRLAKSGIGVQEDLPQQEGLPSLAGTIKGFSFPTTQFEDWTYPAGYAISRNDLRSMNPHVLYAWCTMQQAIQDAALSPELVSHPRTGAMCASGGSAWITYENLHVMETAGVYRCYPLALPAGIPGTLNLNLAASYKLKGAVLGFISACASSAHALGYAFDQIQLNRQDVMFVVGAEDCNRFSILPFAGLRALSTRSNPQVTPSPFDADRDGFVVTGGATTLVLEELNHARKRGAKIYAEVLGWGEAADGYNVMAPEPNGEGLVRAMNLALEGAEVAPEAVDYLNAHATGTTAGDLAEIRAVCSVFKTGRVPSISSTKALTGHGLCLAGAMEAAFTALTLSEGFMPISAKINRLDPAFAGLPILTSPVDSRPVIAMSNSSGFGGANVSLVFRRWEET